MAIDYESIEMQIFEATGNIGLATGAVEYMREQVANGTLDPNDIKQLSIVVIDVPMNDDENAGE